MRFSQVAAGALCALAARAEYFPDAENADAAPSSVEAESASSSTVVSKPTFTPTKIKAPFLEQFTDDWDSRWQPSHAKKEQDKSAEEEWVYSGNWAVEEPTVLKGMEGDKGLVVKDKAAHHAISAKFAKPIDAKNKPLVVQYEVKLQDGLDCGGAYMKLLQNNKKLHQEEFSNASPYIIMFGPDKCGATNKVHFIFRHKNPKTGEYEEKHLNTPPAARIAKTSSLYQLVVHPNNTFAINIDGEEARQGSLLEDFTPSVNPPKEVDDEKDTKPGDWVDEARIKDPEATKPEDWDEDQPYEILDQAATKPEDWLDSEPDMVPDPEGQKPEDWDDEEDGDWIPLKVANPKCADVSGCGEWERPMIKNPEYKGKWSAPYIDNPAYKGEWAPRKIANPKYFEDKHPAHFEPLGAIGFELWTMSNEILFDNIYIGHSVEDANALKAESWDLKVAAEKIEEELTKPKTEEPPAPFSRTLMDDPINFIRERLDLFYTLAKADPMQAIKFMPEVAASIGGVIALVIALVVAVFSGSPAAPSKEDIKGAAKKASDKAGQAKDKAAAAVSTGAEKVQAEVQKRTTRSSEKS